MTFEPVRTGVVGIGDISTVYLNAIARSPALELTALSSRTPERARAAAHTYACRSATVDELLADDTIELVVNLTPAVEHERLNAAVIEARKSLYSEKPFSLSLAAATLLAQAAEAKGVLIGTAPDTFLGASHQAARRLLDDGAIGKPVFGLSFIGFPGIEFFHPKPQSFYRAGGEPPFDIGPYYLTQWINLLGPVRRVYASAGNGPAERVIKRGPNAGTRFAVEVPTTFNTVLTFDEASVSLIMSLDVQELAPRPNELFGSNGSIGLTDPNFFGGALTTFEPGKGRQTVDTAQAPFGRHNRLNHAGVAVADYRGAGLVDLAIALREGGDHRTGPDLIVHVAEVMESIVRSGRENKQVEISSTCTRPAPIDPQRDRLLIELTRSPFDFDEQARQGPTEALQN